MPVKKKTLEGVSHTSQDDIIDWAVEYISGIYSSKVSKEVFEYRDLDVGQYNLA